MHAGIFTVMSKVVGLAFLTALPTYVVGFGVADEGWPSRCVAVLAGLGPTVASLCFGAHPE